MIRIKFFIACLLLTIACNNDNVGSDDVACDPGSGPVFDIDLFIQLVNDEMTAIPAAGYQFVVNQDGEFYHQSANGVSRHELDLGGAIALMNAMEQNEVGLDSTVVNFLPPSWIV